MAKRIFTPLLAGGLAVVITTATAASTGRTAAVQTHAATVTTQITLSKGAGDRSAA